MTIEDEIRALISERLDMGRDTIGPFRDDDPRDMRQEASEEALDAAIYLARLCLQLLDYREEMAELRRYDVRRLLRCPECGGGINLDDTPLAALLAWHGREE